MPLHDWTRLTTGTFHDFHCSWIFTIKNALNNGLLPTDFYAQAEQITGRIGPDVVTLQANAAVGAGFGSGVPGATAVATAPPKVRFTATAEHNAYARKQRTLVIRHTSGDRVIAMIEILSPGNKDHRKALRAVVKKAYGALCRGYHLLLIDVLPPGPGDPHGIHGATWAKIARSRFVAPPDKPLTLAAYVATTPFEAYVEPIAVGDRLTPMPLFLDSESYVSVPMEETYAAAWNSLPVQVREVLDASARPG